MAAEFLDVFLFFLNFKVLDHVRKKTKKYFQKYLSTRQSILPVSKIIPVAVTILVASKTNSSAKNDWTMFLMTCLICYQVNQASNLRIA